jgi:NADPH:quinone reductase-like Zn-dependent oxidoreductase
VRFSRGDDGRALYVLSQIGDLLAAGQFALPAVQTFPLADAAQAHRIGEAGGASGKLVLLANDRSAESGHQPAEGRRS